MTGPVIKVTSKSFSSHRVLRDELCAAFPGAVFNDEATRGTRKRISLPILMVRMVLWWAWSQSRTGCLPACPDLQIVSKYGVGLDNIDQAACADRQVHIGWTGGVNRLRARRGRNGSVLYDRAQLKYFVCSARPAGQTGLDQSRGRRFERPNSWPHRCGPYWQGRHWASATLRM